jgi:hypothetical protein
VAAEVPPLGGKSKPVWSSPIAGESAGPHPQRGLLLAHFSLFPNFRPVHLAFAVNEEELPCDSAKTAVSRS